ncbi:MAG: hypothetical protein ABJB12_05455 [Pseudomonadota bacterium]
MRFSVERLAPEHRQFSTLGWNGLTLVLGAVCGVGCGSRSALDAAEQSASAGPAGDGSNPGEPQGAQSSMPGGSGDASTGGASTGGASTGGASTGGASTGGASQTGGEAGTATDIPKDIPAATSGTRLKAQFLSTPDGTAQFVGFYDRERDEPCQLRVMPDDRVWCIPTAERTDTFYIRDGRPTSGTGPYAHADCTHQMYVDPSPSCPNVPRTRYWVTHTEREGAGQISCEDPDWTIRQIGDPIEPDFEGSYYRDQDGVCYHTSFVSSGQFYELGDPIPHSAFALAHEQNRDMPARLVVREWVGDDGSRQALGWYDTKRREPCSSTLSEDDSTRCVPQAQGYGDYYDDVACMDPVVDLGGRAYCKAPPLKYGGRILGNESCSVSTALYEIGEAVPNGTDVLYGGGGCSQAWSTASSDHPFARLGAAIPARTFDPLRAVWVGPGRLREERRANPEGFTLPASLEVPLGMWTAPPRYADSERKEFCYFQTTEDGVSRCVPLTYTIDGWKPNETPRPPTTSSLDPSCKSIDLSFLRRHYCAPLGSSPPESDYPDAPKAIATTMQVDSCSSFPALWTVAEPHHPKTEPIYWLGNQLEPVCTQLPPSGLDYFGVVGERIPRTAFQAAVLITEQ